MTLADTVRALAQKVFNNELLSGFDITKAVTVSYLSTAGEYDPAQDAIVGSVTKSETQQAQIISYNATLAPFSTGVLALSDIICVFLKSDTLHEPTVGDLVTVDAIAYRISEVAPQYVAAEKFKFTCSCKKV
jgi:hypothetical protein